MRAGARASVRMRGRATAYPTASAARALQFVGTHSALACIVTPMQVGNGKRAYERAKALLKRWAHFQLSWAQVRARACPMLP